MGYQGHAVMQASAAPASGGAAGLSAKVLASRAAAAALSGPAVTAGQWVYRRWAVVATPGNAASPVTGSDAGPVTVPVENGDAWTCTITNTRQTGTITVTKAASVDAFAAKLEP